MKTFDLAIIGGGPAGASAAIRAARAGMQVLLLDRDSFPRQKVCGEFVSAESLSLLADLLGRNHPLLLESLVISAGRLFLGGGMVETRIVPAALSIPRYELDHALWQAAKDAGVDARSSEPVTKVLGDGPFHICTPRGSYAASALIHASGRWSGLFRSLEPPRGPKWLGLKAHYQTPAPANSVDLYFFKHGYCGVQPVDAGVVNICAMVRSDVATSLEEMMEHHPALKRRGLEMRRLTEPVATAPLVHDEPVPTIGNVLQAGDAAGFIDPFLGDGISLALLTGARAVDALLPFTLKKVTLAQAASDYAAIYRRNVLPAFHHAARLRRFLAIAQPLQPAVVGLMKMPHVAEWLLRKTRAAALQTD